MSREGEDEPDGRAFRFIDTDAISPTGIEHSVEEVWDGDILQAYYNFLDYHFEVSGAYLRARVYLDERDRVWLFGPFEGRDNLSEISAPGAEQPVLAYLVRRFGTVGRFDEGSGYRTVEPDILRQAALAHPAR